MEKINKLIAEFMGMTNDVPHDKSMMVRKTPQGNEVVPINALQYDSSWDWLMPVVNEIIKSRDEQNADWDFTDLKYALCTANIEWVYKAVVEFVKLKKEQYV